MKKHKVLISCYACSPYRGSEPGVGWNFVKGISQYFEVHVIVEKEKWEHDIKDYINKNPALFNDMHFYFLQKKRNRKLRKIWPPSYYWFYREWQKNAFELGKKLHFEHKFDLIHQLNMVGYREPGYMWKLDAPFVWGPIGGLEITPWNFLNSIGFKGMIHFIGRNAINFIQKKYLKRPQKAAKKTNSYLISATPENQQEILRLWGVESEVITEVGTNQLQGKVIKRNLKEPLIIVWNGIHEPRKNLGLLLKALAKSEAINFELHILGKGSETNKWKRKAEKLGLKEKCIWYGWLPLHEVHYVYKKGHVFCITSVHDLTSTVLMEALSFGLPVISLDHCGFSYVVDDSCGIKIPVIRPKQAIKDFEITLNKLFNDELLRQRLSEGSIQRAKIFSWQEKIDKLMVIYRRALQNN